MRRSGAALVVAGIACVAGAALPMATAGAADGTLGSGLGSYALNGFAQGVQLRVGEPNFCYTTTAAANGCEGALPEATTTLQNGPTGQALASVAWPGALAADLGDLLITASNGQIPSQATALNTPVRAQVRMGQTPDTVTNTQVQGTTMTATAKPEVTSADAHVDSVTAPVGTFGPSTAAAKTNLTGPASAMSAAKSSVSDITLATVVHIGSVTSEATATTDGKAAKVSGHTTVTGATVAGVPVNIDENGVTVQGQGAALGALQNQVNGALSNAGLTLRVSQPQGKPDGASVSYTSGSLVAVFAPQAGYTFTISLGGANVTATSIPGFDFPSGSTGGTTGGTTTGSTTTSGGTGGSSAGTTSGSGGFSGNPTTTGGVPTTTGGTTGAPPTIANPGTSNAAVSRPLYGGLSPFLPVLGLVGVGLMAFGFKRLPDKVLEAVPPVCPLEENR